MNVILRSLCAVALSMILCLTSQTMAVAQGQAAAVGEIEICHGLGVISIPVDANGAPTGPPIVCPDFAAAIGLEGEDHTQISAPRPVWVSSEFVLANSSDYRRFAPVASARGPPAPL